MNTENLGNNLNVIICDTRSALFNQGELAQLAYGAFDIAATAMQSSEDDEIEITYPVGYRPDKTPIQSKHKYKKEDLLKRYQYLAWQQLPENGIVQLVTIIEAMLGEIIRAVVMKYPQKLSSKRTIKMQAVLEATSIDEVHLNATDSLLYDLTYKSPNDFAEAIQPILSINLLECPAFHRYMEIKASRDIYIHNLGIVNELYIKKAGSHIRATKGMRLPADTVYFLESYEHCIQLTEWLEAQLHTHWHSNAYEEKKNKQLEMKLSQKDKDGV